jgi:hypothetical protein
MFCAHCGKAMIADAMTCEACGKPRAVPSQTLQAADIGQLVASHAKKATTSALAAFKTFAVNPVGGLRPAMDGLGPRNALGSAIVFALFFSLCLVIGMRRAASSGESILGLLGGGGLEMSFGVFKLLFCGFVPFVGIFGAGWITRKIFRGAGNPEGDAFIAGAALLPIAFLLLIAGVLGLANVEALAILSVFTLCYVILIIHTGCRDISSIAEPGATIAVPVILLASAWFTKIILVAVL